MNDEGTTGGHSSYAESSQIERKFNTAVAVQSTPEEFIPYILASNNIAIVGAKMDYWHLYNPGIPPTLVGYGDRMA